MVRFRDGRLVRSQNHLGFVIVNMECSKNQDQTRKSCVRRDRLEPVIVQTKQAHLWLCCSENQVSKLFNLQASLERKLKFRSLDDNVGEIYRAREGAANQYTERATSTFGDS